MPQTSKLVLSSALVRDRYSTNESEIPSAPTSLPKKPKYSVDLLREKKQLLNIFTLWQMVTKTEGF